MLKFFMRLIMIFELISINSHLYDISVKLNRGAVHGQDTSHEN